MGLPFAFSFAEWLCKGCRNRVEWADAIAVVTEDGKCDGFVHAECSDG